MLRMASDGPALTVAVLQRDQLALEQALTFL